MGMDLLRRRDSVKWTCNNQLWIFILETAKKNGWVPLGVSYLNNSNKNDKFDYQIQNGQIVLPKDAMNMYKALTKEMSSKKLVGIELEITQSFVNWLVKKNSDGQNEFPGFIIN